MTANSQKIKEAIQAKTGTLEEAARRMSNKEYSFSASTLSKVIRGERHGKIAVLVQRRIERLLGQRVYSDPPPTPQPETLVQANQI